MFARVLLLVIGLYSVLVVGVALAQRALLYYPTHYEGRGPLTPWTVAGETVGYARELASPREVWLLLHGNGGQAAQRGYFLEVLGPEAALYVLEYPGYGARPGRPARATINAAARDGWRALRERWPGVPMGVIGESLGSGPASELAREGQPPNQIVLWTPYDRLVDVAREKFRWLPVGWLLRDRWDNGASLQGFGGVVEIYAAAQDEVIPPHHARRLHARVPGSRWFELAGGHNDWHWNGVLRVEKAARR